MTMSMNFKKRHQRFVDELRLTVIRDDKSKKSKNLSSQAKIYATGFVNWK